MATTVRGARFGGRGTGRGAARLRARAPVRTGAVLDTALLALCTLTALALVFLPVELRDRAAAALRRTAVAPLAVLQREAELTRARYQSYEDRVNQRGQLARDAADVTGLRAENDRLRRLLGLGARLQWGFRVAEAIPNQLASELAREQVMQTFMLTEGGRAGVAAFAPVVAADGLVGMVEQVDPAMSVAITYAHPDFRVSAQTPDASAYGIVQPHLGGVDRGLLEMRGVAFRSPLKPGQLVVSSGYGATYPSGIPVGTVVREIQTPERWARTYLLQPAVSLADVGAVLILTKDRADARVDSVWVSLPSADSAARGVAAAGDSLARDALLREAAARRAALGTAAPDSAAPDSAGVVPAARPDSGAPAPSEAPAPAGDPAPAAATVPRPTVPRPTVPGPATVRPDAPATRAPGASAPATSAPAARAPTARRDSAAVRTRATTTPPATSPPAGSVRRTTPSRPDTAARRAAGAGAPAAGRATRPTVPPPARVPGNAATAEPGRRTGP